MKCSRCNRKTKGKKLAKGWHRDPADRDLATAEKRPVCETCWHKAYVLRAIEIPVVKPLGTSWEAFRKALTEAWSHSTSLVNWATSHTFVQDEQRRPDQQKITKMPKVYLYPQATKRFPALPTQTVATTINSSQAKYRKRRYEVLWTGEASLPNARYPQPFASPNQSWTAAYIPAGADGNGDKLPAVEVTLLRGQRFTLQLRGGRDFRRQLGDFAKIVNGQAVQGQLELLRRRVGGNENRNGVTDRDSGGQKAHYRVMAKMVAWFPRIKRGPADGTLFVRTDREAFLVALDAENQRLWWLNADHVRQWVAEHRRRLQRWSEDQKAEQRPVASFQSKREAAVLKFRDRIGTFQKQAAAQLANFAQRRRMATVRYDDRERDYLERFDWSGFKTRLQTKLDEYGITLDCASGEVAQDNPKTAREETTE